MASVSKSYITAQEVAHSLLSLVDKSGGTLRGCEVGIFCSKRAGFKQAIKEAGGLKKFCEAHADLEFVATKTSGYVKRCAKLVEANQCTHLAVSQQGVVKAVTEFNDSRGGQVTGDQFAEVSASQTSVTAQEVARTLLGLVDKRGGKLNASEIGKVCSQRGENFKHAIKEAGGVKKFCEAHADLEFVATKGCGYITRCAKPVKADACTQKAVSQQDIVNGVTEFIDSQGGKLAGDRFAEVYKKCPLIKPLVTAAGGAKAFCSSCPELRVVTPDAGPWAVQLARSAHRTMPVKDIHWCQNTINVRFRSGRLLAETLQELLSKPSLIQTLPVLEVVKKGDRFYAVSGNRRLWVLKEYSAIQEARGKSPLSVTVKVRDEKRAAQAWVKERFSTRCEGHKIDIVVKHHLQNRERFPTMALAMAAEMLRSCKARRTASASDTESTNDGNDSSDEA
eukprot:TRINITY_DN732_c0_g1_i4.p1 TRINITY_DN732_c0_g1~~TRINITY_DN732_c0_g1_i4.p1  ORF type:complete len:450 (-),score=93.81 TRINITY_DN732_c0_g1_i4:303-1652(-)